MLEKDFDSCVVGAGPGGLMTALLLALKGHRVLVLEKADNFDREYRGEVLTPRFHQMMAAIGMEDLLAAKHRGRFQKAKISWQQDTLAEIDFERLCPNFPYALWIPQPELLQILNDRFLAAGGEIVFSARVKNLIFEKEDIIGICYEAGDDQAYRIRSKVIIGSDGRQSQVARLAGFEKKFEDHSFDVLWTTVERSAGVFSGVSVFLGQQDRVLVLPKYPNHLQLGLIIAPNSFPSIRQRGFDNFKQRLQSAIPALDLSELNSFKQVALLRAVQHEMNGWAKTGCLLVGDAAHTFSPAGAVGVSMAVGTAIVAANVIDAGLREGNLSAAHLNQVESLRRDDIDQVQILQRALSTRIAQPRPWVNRILPWVLPLVSKTPFFYKTIQKMITIGDKPLACLAAGSRRFPSGPPASPECG